MHITLQDIHKSHRSESGRERKILTGLSMQVEKGATVSIAGPSGCGKTTLLNIIGALDQPDAGRVLFEGEDITSFSRNELAAFRNRSIGFVFQKHHLLPQCTLLENVLLPIIPLPNVQKKNESAQRANDLLKRTGIWEQRRQKPGELSGGECQRAAVVRALVNGPGLLLAGDPTGALDQQNSEKLADLLFELNETEGVTLILVTHDLNLAGRAKEQYWLNDGKLFTTKTLRVSPKL